MKEKALHLQEKHYISKTWTFIWIHEIICKMTRRSHDSFIISYTWSSERVFDFGRSSTGCTYFPDPIICYRPPRNVMFSQVSVILSTIGLMPTQSLLILTGYSVTCYGAVVWCGRYATYWNAFLSQVCIHDVTVMIQWDQMLHIDIPISQKKHNHNFWWFFSCHSNWSYLSYGKTFCPWLCEYTLQEDQTIRTFAIFPKFLTLKLVLWAMEKCTFSTIQPISEKISGKYIYRKI